MNRRIIHAFKFINYRLFSTHKKGHGIHSPFTFQLIRQVFNKKEINSELAMVIQAHKQLIQSRESVKQFEIGASSMYSPEKNIGKIIKHSSVNKKYGVLLFNLVKYFNAKNILELGSSVGISASYIAQGAKNANFISIEGNNSKIKRRKSTRQIPRTSIS